MDKIKGVNLGGWFVLERWMRQSLFNDIDSKDETGFVTKHPNAKTVLEDHWNTWITYKDFVFLKKHGINSVRLPIPWWLKGDAPYFSSIKYIKRALKWAEKAGLSVMLDLHTAPGCQNGFDNGGIEGVIDWPKDPANIKLTVKKLGFIAKTLGSFDSVFAIQVLNEPHYTIDLDLIQKFYKDAYKEIRKHTDKMVVFHDAFRPHDLSWEPFFKENKFSNVAFDLHLYHCFDEKLIHGDVKTHIDVVMDVRIPLIQSLEKFVKVFIGEWSLGIRHQTLVKDEGFDLVRFEHLLADLQLYAYSYATGYYFWSYRIEHDTTRHGWHLRQLIEDGTFNI